MNTRLIPLFALLALLVGGPLAAQTLPEEQEGPPWYQVELYIFAQPGQALYDEYWDDHLTPSHSPDAIRLIGDPLATAVTDPAYAQGAFTLLPDAELQLPLDPGHLARRGYRPLFHGAWRQPMLERARSRPILINGGTLLENGQPELSGEITLDIARYLHLRTNLFFSQRLPETWVSALPDAASTAADSQTTEYPMGASALFAPPPPAARYLSVNMDHARRMRSRELHYIDHPMFGLMIKITPWEPPESGPAPASPQTQQAPAPTQAAPVRLPIPVNAPRMSGTQP